MAMFTFITLFKKGGFLKLGQNKKVVVFRYHPLKKKEG